MTIPISTPYPGACFACQRRLSSRPLPQHTSIAGPPPVRSNARCGGTSATITSWSDTSVKFNVPSVSNGVYQVQLKNSSGTNANTIQFTVLTARLIPVTFTVNNATPTNVGDYIFLTGNTVERTRETVLDGLGPAFLLPGLIDCHTHLVFGGDRAGEWEQRLAGASYEDIAAAGGGIRSTVQATRAATDDELLDGAVARAAALAAGGVTTIEVKSGYGLDRDTEVRQLDVVRRARGRQQWKQRAARV